MDPDSRGGENGELSVTDEYRAFLQRKVDVARASVRAGRCYPNDEVDADFAARRTRIDDKAKRLSER